MYAVILIFGNAGLLNKGVVALGLSDMPIRFIYSELGVIIGLVIGNIAYFVLSCYPSIVRIPRSTIEAAAILGARPHRILTDVVVPSTLPGIGAGFVIVFLMCLNSYITPALLGGRVRANGRECSLRSSHQHLAAKSGFLFVRRPFGDQLPASRYRSSLGAQWATVMHQGSAPLPSSDPSFTRWRPFHLCHFFFHRRHRHFVLLGITEHAVSAREMGIFVVLSAFSREDFVNGLAFSAVIALIATVTMMAYCLPLGYHRRRSDDAVPSLLATLALRPFSSPRSS